MTADPDDVAAGDGVPLGRYRGTEDPGVWLHCTDCARARSFGLEAVIARLIALGIGDENTGVRAVARVARARCPWCGSAAIASTPHRGHQAHIDGLREFARRWPAIAARRGLA